MNSPSSYFTNHFILVVLLSDFDNHFLISLIFCEVKLEARSSNLVITNFDATTQGRSIYPQMKKLMELTGTIDAVSHFTSLKYQLRVDFH